MYWQLQNEIREIKHALASKRCETMEDPMVEQICDDVSLGKQHVSQETTPADARTEVDAKVCGHVHVQHCVACISAGGYTWVHAHVYMCPCVLLRCVQAPSFL